MTPPFRDRVVAAGRRPGPAGWLVLIVLLTSSAVAAQQLTFTQTVSAVRVDVLVTDRGQPVPGLGAGDFDVRDNGVPQKVDLVNFETVPLNVVLALDVSGSVNGKQFDELRAAGEGVVNALKPGDQVALLTFNEAVTLRTGLTTSAARVRAALAQQPGLGETALVNASYSAIVLGESDTHRALAIVFSDGADTASFLRPDSVIDTAKRSDAVVYAVTPGGAAPFLQQLCEQTGGRVVGVGSTTRVAETFLSILNEFRHRYLVSYTPTGVAKPGWHRLDVRVRNHRGADVRARPGYLAQ